MFTPGRIPAGMACLALMGLGACASNPIPFGARVDPTNVGVESSLKRDGFHPVYVWQVHDFDGTTHILTWKDTSGKAREVLTEFNSCRTQGQTNGAGRLDEVAAERPHAPTIFPQMLACATSANMSGFEETVGPRATEYRVAIVTGAAAVYMAAGEIPLNPKLGGLRIVDTHTETDKKTIVADVESCLSVAASPGVIDDCGTTLRQCQTINPMLDRFDQCLRSRSYAVQPCSGPEQCPVPGHKLYLRSE
jgi:hypothetical protein